MVYNAIVKFRMKTGKVSTKDQPDQRKKNNTRPPKDLQHNELIQHPRLMFKL